MTTKTEAPPYIEGFTISGYRSFGSPQRIGPLRKVSLFAGANNSGKSSILKFCHEQLGPWLEAIRGQQQRTAYAELDSRSSTATAIFEFAYDYNRLLDHLTQQRVAPDLARKVLAPWCDARTVVWVPFEQSTTSSRALTITTRLHEAAQADGLLPSHQWRQVSEALTNQRGGNVSNWIAWTLQFLGRTTAPASPATVLIPAFRRIGEGELDLREFGGAGLIGKLMELQAPEHNRQDDRRRFGEINRFLREVTGNDTATIEVPASRSHINVHMDGVWRPLASLGTGIHQSVILAAAATIISDSVVCMEEPEIHLHPLLQRKLLSHLHRHTTNQYLIATHSAHLLEESGAAVFHIRLHSDESGEQETRVLAVDKPADRWAICQDLGYRASDLIQSNCVIWVEGPSDRIYIAHWLKAVDPELIEGIHYSVMFYGGRLLNHLSANDPEIDEFISLRRLNRNLAIVMDSDRSRPRTQLMKTKKRIKHEIGGAPCSCVWVTKGREIENYVASTIMAEAVEAVAAGRGKAIGQGPFDRVLPTHSRTGVVVDKIKVARQVAARPAAVDVLDLEQRLVELVAFIRRANDSGAGA